MPAIKFYPLSLSRFYLQNRGEPKDNKENRENREN